MKDKCKKCNGTVTTIKYHLELIDPDHPFYDESMDMDKAGFYESLLVRCSTCGYRWTKPTADNQLT